MKLPAFRFGIFAKILLAFLGFLFVSLSIIFVVFNWVARDDLMRSHRDQDLRQVDDVRHYLEQAYKERWSVDAVKAGLRLVIPVEMRSLSVLDRQTGRIILQISDTQNTDLLPTPAIIQDVLKRSEMTNNKYEVQTADNAVSVVSGVVMINNNPQWTVMMISKTFQADFRKTNNKLLLAILITLSVCIIFSLIMSRQITKRVKQLTKVSREIAKGNFDPDIRTNSKDELGELALSVKQMANDLGGMDRMRKEFVANVSHDLRSPLTSMNGYVEAMLDGTVPEKRMKHYLGILQDLNGRLIRLVNDLLDMSKIDSGSLEMHFGHFNVTEIIRQVLASMEPQFAHHQVIFQVYPRKCDIDGMEFIDEDIQVYGDPDRIKQVLTNLIQNAVEFSPREQPIMVSLYEQERAIISVEDHGIGMSPEQVERIWERFYKVDTARTRRTGTGIGLSIVKMIIERHHTDILVQSIPGQGTKFTFSLAYDEQQFLKDGLNS